MVAFLKNAFGIVFVFIRILHTHLKNLLQLKLENAFDKLKPKI